MNPQDVTCLPGFLKDFRCTLIDQSKLDADLDFGLKLVLGRNIRLFKVRFLANIIKVPFIKWIDWNMKSLFVWLFLDFTKESCNSNVACRDLLVQGRCEP